MAMPAYPESSAHRRLGTVSSLRVLRLGKLLACAFSCLTIAVPARALTGDEVMLRSLQVRTVGDSASSTLRVELRAKDGAKVTRTVETYRKDCDGSSRQLVVMREPADVAGAAFLSWIHRDRYPDMWLYLPELGRP